MEAALQLCRSSSSFTLELIQLMIARDLVANKQEAFWGHLLMGGMCAWGTPKGSAAVTSSAKFPLCMRCCSPAAVWGRTKIAGHAVGLSHFTLTGAHIMLLRIPVLHLLLYL